MAEWSNAAVLKIANRKVPGFESQSLRLGLRAARSRPGFGPCLRTLPGDTGIDTHCDPHLRSAGVAHTCVGRIIAELSAVSYESVLYLTPTPALPDHHSLAVARSGQVLPQLSDDAGVALLRALDTVDNPYRSQP